MKRTALVILGLGILPVLAHAECGWLLLEPPMTGELSKGTFKPQLARPMVEWRQHSAHDSAEACERAKSQAVAKLNAATEQITDPRIRQEATVVVVIAGMSYRCVPASQVPIR